MQTGTLSTVFKTSCAVQLQHPLWECAWPPRHTMYWTSEHRPACLDDLDAARARAGGAPALAAASGGRQSRSRPRRWGTGAGRHCCRRTCARGSRTGCPGAQTARVPPGDCSPASGRAGPGRPCRADAGEWEQASSAPQVFVIRYLSTMVAICMTCLKCMTPRCRQACKAVDLSTLPMVPGPFADRSASEQITATCTCEAYIYLDCAAQKQALHPL